MSTNESSIRVLLIEDNPGDVRLIREMLQEAKRRKVVLEHCATLTEGLQALSKNDFDVLLLDLTLPDSIGFDTFAKVYTQNRQTPIVVLSGTNDEELAIRSVRTGAQDYLIKGQIDSSLLTRSISYAIERAGLLRVVQQELIERKRAEGALKESESRFRSIVESGNDGIIFFDGKTRKILFGNSAMAEMLGCSREDLVGRSISSLHPPGEWASIEQEFQKHVSGELSLSTGVPIIRGDSSVFYADVSSSSITLDGRHYFSAFFRDISEQKRLAEELRQAQKMESIGTLASGIAHDFNNILGIIMGHASVIARTGQDSPQFPLSIDAITKATWRGASLVKQMLTFAQKAETVFEPLQVNSIVVETARLLRETLPQAIILTMDLDNDLPWVIADSTQLHQVLLNLCVNARDAMPAGGTLVISTSTVDAGRLTTKPPQADSNEFVLLRVTDSGMGMDEATKQKIFEPFFTTKGPGLGTGLGLAVVYGIITSHNGLIEVESEEGKGTTFNVYLPVRQSNLAVEGDTEENAEDVPGGNETILLIEDEELLSDMLKVVLENKGYTVLVARDGEEGVSAYSAHRKEIDVVICDFGLPKLEGDMVLKKIRSMNPEAKVVLASGFIEPGTKSELEKAGAKCFVQKPYGANEVLGIVRKTIDMKE